MDLYAGIASLAGIDGRGLDLNSIDLGPTLFKGQASPRMKLLYYNAAGELLGYRNGHGIEPCARAPGEYQPLAGLMVSSDW